MKSKRRSKASFAARAKKLKLEDSPDEIAIIPEDTETIGRCRRSTSSVRTACSKDDAPPQSVTISDQDFSENKMCPDIQSFCIEQNDKVDKKVDFIIKDIENNTLRSLTIEGSGLGIEKTISVVEELKNHLFSQGTKYEQKTSISAGLNNQPHLVVVLRLMEGCITV